MLAELADPHISITNKIDNWDYDSDQNHHQNHYDSW